MAAVFISLEAGGAPLDVRFGTVAPAPDNRQTVWPGSSIRLIRPSDQDEMTVLPRDSGVSVYRVVPIPTFDTEDRYHDLPNTVEGAAVPDAPGVQALPDHDGRVLLSQDVPITVDFYSGDLVVQTNELAVGSAQAPNSAWS